MNVAPHPLPLQHKRYEIRIDPVRHLSVLVEEERTPKMARPPPVLVLVPPPMPFLPVTVAASMAVINAHHKKKPAEMRRATPVFGGTTHFLKSDQAANRPIKLPPIPSPILARLSTTMSGGNNLLASPPNTPNRGGKKHELLGARKSTMDSYMQPRAFSLPQFYDDVEDSSTEEVVVVQPSINNAARKSQGSLDVIDLISLSSDEDEAKEDQKALLRNVARNLPSISFTRTLQPNPVLLLSSRSLVIDLSEESPASKVPITPVAAAPTILEEKNEAKIEEDSHTLSIPSPKVSLPKEKESSKPSTRKKAKLERFVTEDTIPGSPASAELRDESPPLCGQPSNVDATNCSSGKNLIGPIKTLGLDTFENFLYFALKSLGEDVETTHLVRSGNNRLEVGF